jgi:hypothetical protein
MNARLPPHQRRPFQNPRPAAFAEISRVARAASFPGWHDASIYARACTHPLVTQTIASSAPALATASASAKSSDRARPYPDDSPLPRRPSPHALPPTPLHTTPSSPSFRSRCPPLPHVVARSRCSLRARSTCPCGVVRTTTS